MNTIDRIAGYNRARIIEIKNIESFNVTGNKCEITPKVGFDFIELDYQKNTITPSVISSNDKGGIVYKIGIDIDLKNESSIKTIGFNKYLAILDNPVAGPMVFGTLQFPLTLTKQPITSSTASGKIGESIHLEGKQLNYPYLFAEL